MKNNNSLSTLITALLLATQGCALLEGEASTINSCRKSLKSALNDPDSYREATKPTKAQEYPGNPPVFGWQFNAKNSFGGYGEPLTVLCYKPRGEEVVIATFKSDESKDKRNFLAITNPKIRSEIEKEKEDMENFFEKLEAESAAKTKKTEQSFEEISRFCGHWLKGIAKANDGTYLWSQPIVKRYGIKSEQEGRMDPLSAICLTYGMNRDSEKSYGSQPKSLIYKTTYDDIPEWNKYRQKVCASDPHFCT